MTHARTLLAPTFYRKADGGHALLDANTGESMTRRARDALGTSPVTLDALADAYVLNGHLMEMSLCSEGFGSTQGKSLRTVYDRKEVPESLRTLLLNAQASGAEDIAALDEALAVLLLETVLPHAAKRHGETIRAAYIGGVRTRLAAGAKGYVDCGIEDGGIYGRRLAYFDRVLGLGKKSEGAPDQPSPARWVG